MYADPFPSPAHYRSALEAAYRATADGLVRALELVYVPLLRQHLHAAAELAGQALLRALAAAQVLLHVHRLGGQNECVSFREDI